MHESDSPADRPGPGSPDDPDVPDADAGAATDETVDAGVDDDEESGRSRLRLPGRADVLGAASRLIWRRRNARAQRLAGEASAKNAVRLDPEAPPGPDEADGADTADEADGAAAPGTATDTDTAADTAAPDAAAPGASAPTVTPTEPVTPAEPATPAEAVSPPAEPAAPAEAAPGEAADDERAAEPFVPDPRVAAFFDVDNTLIQGASIILLARGLAKHKFFTGRDLAGMAWTQLKFRVSGKENAEDVAAGREKALSFIEGRTVTELMELSQEVVDGTMLDRVWPGTRALVQMHLDAGQQVWLVTATPVELARVIATRLGLSGALGTVAEDHVGVYTGKLVGDILHGPGKAHAVSALAESEGFDLTRCYAYSDSFNDMPMLTLVGNPVAINPDTKLRKYAGENGWDIKDFRTVRKAARKAVPGVLAVGGLAGAHAAARSPYGVRAIGRARRMF